MNKELKKLYDSYCEGPISVYELAENAYELGKKHALKPKYTVECREENALYILKDPEGETVNCFYLRNSSKELTERLANACCDLLNGEE